MRQLKYSFWPQIFIVYSRFVLGGGFVYASIIKIKGKRFTTLPHEDADFGTPFHFFETLFQTGIYWQFLGWGQLIAGLLLMTQRYAKLGTVVNLPIILNVFMITASLDFGYTRVITLLMLLTNVLLICWHWDSLRVLVNLPSQETLVFREENQPIWEVTGLLLFLFTAGYRTARDLHDPIFWFGLCTVIAGTAFSLRLFWKKRSQKSGWLLRDEWSR